MEPCSVSTAATRRTPKSSVRTRMPVTGQFSMIWEREEKLLPQPPAPLAGPPPCHRPILVGLGPLPLPGRAGSA